MGVLGLGSDGPNNNKRPSVGSGSFVNQNRPGAWGLLTRSLGPGFSPPCEEIGFFCIKPLLTFRLVRQRRHHCGVSHATATYRGFVRGQVQQAAAGCVGERKRKCIFFRERPQHQKCITCAIDLHKTTLQRHEPRNGLQTNRQP